MVKVLLDACVPHWLRQELTEFEVETSHYAGLDQLSDSPLLAAIDGRYDVLVTLDRNLTFQQKIAGRPVAVIVLRTRDQSPGAFRAMLAALNTAIAHAVPGSVAVVSGDAS